MKKIIFSILTCFVTTISLSQQFPILMMMLITEILLSQRHFHGLGTISISRLFLTALATLRQQVGSSV
jgi:hypothetical protein